MDTIAEALRSRQASWCLDRRVRHTRLRVDEALREIDTLRVHFANGHCGGGAVAGPVIPG